MQNLKALLIKILIFRYIFLLETFELLPWKFMIEDISGYIDNLWLPENEFVSDAVINYIWTDLTVIVVWDTCYPTPSIIYLIYFLLFFTILFCIELSKSFHLMICSILLSIFVWKFENLQTSMSVFLYCIF